MPEITSTIPGSERAPAHIPPQRGGEASSGPVVLTDINQVAEIALKDLVVVGNRTVYGLLGHCDQEGNIQKRVQQVKGEARRNRPLGLTVPFDHEAVKGIFQTSHMDSQIRRFMEADRLTGVVGALAFVRAAANEEHDMPSCVISQPTGKHEDLDHDKPLAQVYSPRGNQLASAIIDLMTDQGGLPIMSSANRSGEPSITTTAKALQFAKEHNLPIFVDLPDSQRDEQPQDSYPVLHVAQSKIHIVRPGFLDEAITRMLLDGLPVANEAPKHPDPNKVLRLVHIAKKYPRAETYRGADMRKCLLEYLDIA